MKHVRIGFYLVVTILTLLVACSPSASPGGTPIVPLIGDDSAATSPPIQHQLIPPAQLPEQRSSHAGDYDSSITAAQKRAAGGDRFTFDQFERPFNADTMDVYFAYVDIQDTKIYQDDTWVYAVITVKGRDANTDMPGKYAVELDLDKDGRGDWLVIVTHPASTDWTTDGVQVFADENGDVGGDIVVNADKKTGGGDGYEKLVFDSGHGDDADAAWARLAPDDPNSVELAGKRALFGGLKAYLAGVWAGTDDLNPAWFDLNDHFTHDEAGEALKELEYYYPIKQLSEVDNTCRMAIGFEANGSEPRVCPVPGVPGACSPPPQGCDTLSGYQWDKKLCCCNYENLGCGY
jgi:hypothetical protein